MKKNVMQIAILFFLSVSIYGQSNFTFYKAINVDVKMKVILQELTNSFP
ncbi:MAG: hypothetical protein H6613_03245 [Ignavibacteriales bacterium]|nr:hypothetical protein [Ignavibacteriales bacterium]